MLFLLVLGIMLGAAAVILHQQWRNGALTAEAQHATQLPPPSLVRPQGIPSETPPRSAPEDERRAA